MLRHAWLAAAALLPTVALAACLERPAAPSPVPPDAAPPVRFAVVGDTGTGDANEYQVARAIGSVCAERGCDFLVHTGDILYDVGPFSVHDTQFETKFEEPYGSLGLPVYLVIGNHDVGGDPHSEADLHRWSSIGDLNVAYHYRTDRTTDAWNMPARWYPVTHGPVSLAFFDSTAFMLVPLESDPDGPLHAAVEAQSAAAMAAWPANATWRFAVAHHPYVSNGEHGDSATYVDGPLHGRVLARFYETQVCGRADVLLTGHDHDLQMLAPVEGCEGTRFLVSGGGARPRELADPDRHPALFQRGGTLGFWWLEAQGDTLRLLAFDGDARLLYEGTILKAPPSGLAGPLPLPVPGGEAPQGPCAAGEVGPRCSAA